MAEIRGTAQADLLAGTPEDDLIFGLMGTDTIAGNSGNDSIFGGKQSDLIDGNSGQDSLFGDLDNDIINGGEGNDFLVGGKGSDSISGNSGNDVLSGDRDTDILIGGDGADLFVLRRYAEADPFRTSGGVSLANADVIADFTPGTDLIGLGEGLSFSDLNILEAGINWRRLDKKNIEKLKQDQEQEGVKPRTKREVITGATES